MGHSLSKRNTAYKVDNLIRVAGENDPPACASRFHRVAFPKRFGPTLADALHVGLALACQEV